MAKFFVPLVAPPPMNNGGGGGSDLPAVSAADNGDVLTVVNGAWDKAAPGGGGGSSVTFCPITVVIDPETDAETATATMTALELWTAAQSGVVAGTWSFTSDGGVTTNYIGQLLCCTYTPAESYYTFRFQVLDTTFVAYADNDYPSFSDGK